MIYNIDEYALLFDCAQTRSNTKKMLALEGWIQGRRWALWRSMVCMIQSLLGLHMYALFNIQ